MRKGIYDVGKGDAGSPQSGAFSKEYFEKQAQRKAKEMARRIPEVSAREERKVMKAIKSHGYYASPAAKKALAASEKKYAEYSKERDSRYKREGLSD